ncbi:hypothetical protein SORBI_3007G092700 [Sorghum bicolor]|uniref:Uncharacterized protein n=1 Tax=Sorghum bicolor TaxID=4558 RepID=A0A1B6PGL7_SORBI|nr:hypothetical protein SORBI_3007G092700 [Sorghum bicolor]
MFRSSVCLRHLRKAPPPIAQSCRNRKFLNLRQRSFSFLLELATGITSPFLRSFSNLLRQRRLPFSGLLHGIELPQASHLRSSATATQASTESRPALISVASGIEPHATVLWIRPSVRRWLLLAADPPGSRAQHLGTRGFWLAVE